MKIILLVYLLHINLLILNYSLENYLIFPSHLQINIETKMLLLFVIKNLLVVLIDKINLNYLLEFL